MENEIVRADKKHRRRVACWTGVGLLGGGVGLFVVWRSLADITAAAGENPSQAAEAAVVLVTVFGWIAAGSLIGAGLWSWRLARKIRRAGRYPPPGAKVVRDTPLRTGAKALTMADLAMGATAVCFLLGTVGVWGLCRWVIGLLAM